MTENSLTYDRLFPKWARELNRYSPVKAMFFLYKNIYDLYFFPLKLSSLNFSNGVASPERIKEFSDSSGRRYAIEEALNNLTLKGFVLPSEKLVLNDIFGKSYEKSIDKFYLDSRDYSAIKDPQSLAWTSLRLEMYLHFLLSMQGYSVICFYDIVDGFTFPFDNKVMKETFLKLVKSKEEDVEISRLERSQLRDNEPDSRNLKNQLKSKLKDALVSIRRAVTNSEVPIAVIMKFSSRILTSPSSLSPDENETFIKIQKIAEDSAYTFSEGYQRRNLFLLISEKLNDLPPWLYLDNPSSKPLQLELPDNYDRKRFFEITKKNFYLNDPKPTAEEETKTERIFTDLTMGMTNVDLDNIKSISVSERVDIRDMKKIIQRYKYGIVESEWDKIETEKLRDAENILRVRVKGQTEAVSHSLDVIKRAKVGLSGIQQSSISNRPRGVLFFAGPTGVGKTELAKALAQFLFGDERKCIRFDMSEYSQEHSDQKLLGAPPGYVGYEEGGQLTNAIKNNPFAILLFDEIEKANPRILDKFLQIIDDGRMTDGKGETVYFSETLIIFTSNLGTYVPDENGNTIQNTSPSMPYREIKEKILLAIQNYFNYSLKRPELLNRFGDNFIIFDYIRPNIAEEIIQKILDSFSEYLLKEKKISLTINKNVTIFIQKMSFERLEHGGRGIGNVIEKHLINPFSRYMFDNNISENSAIQILDILYNEDTDLTTLTIGK
jgi:ATP-dependent Clp protease ATP-binding subunit ClpA